MNEWLGKHLGQYEIVAEIGRGGMAVVYQAWQPSLGRHVAIKVLPVLFASDQEFVARFQREAMSAAQLRHPNIVTIHDVGQEGDTHFIVMEYLEGQSLYHLLRSEGPLPLERVTHITGQIASALDYAHQRGFVHRDIKPANIIVAPGDRATLTDFGIAKAVAGTSLTQTGAMVGTPQYMAPEQIQGASVDHRADIYALGIVVYEMLTGVPPFTGDTAAVLYAQAHKPPPPLNLHIAGLPAYVQRALDRALTKDPAERFSSAGELAAALTTPTVVPATTATQATPPAPTQAAPRPTPPPAPYPSRPRPTPPPSRTGGFGRWALLGAGVAAVLVLGAILALVILSGPGSKQAAVSPTQTRVPAPTTRAPASPTAGATARPATPTREPTALPATPVQPSPGTAAPTVAAEPLRLAFVTGSPGSGSIYIVDADGSRLNRLLGGRFDYAEPDWSPDGTHILYQSDQAGNYDIWVIGADGRDAQQLTTTGDDEREPDWSPDGTRIVYRRGGEPNGDGELWVMDADGRNQRRLGGLVLGRSPVWSPDGQQIAFMSEQDDGWEIYRLDLSTNGVERLTDCSAHCRFPNWSPDGQYILYHSTASASSFTPVTIWRQRASGSSAEMLIHGNEPGRAVWSADGFIAFNTADGIDIARADGSDRHALTNGDDGWAPDWSR